MWNSVDPTTSQGVFCRELPLYSLLLLQWTHREVVVEQDLGVTRRRSYHCVGSVFFLLVKPSDPMTSRNYYLWRYMLVLSSTNTRQFAVLFLNKELFCFVFSPLPKTIIKSNYPYKYIGCAELLSAVRNRDSDFVRNDQFSSKFRINTGTAYVILHSLGWYSL